MEALNESWFRLTFETVSFFFWLKHLDSSPCLRSVVMSLFHVLVLPAAKVSLSKSLGASLSNFHACKSQGLLLPASPDIPNVSSKFGKSLSSCFGMMW